MFYSYPMGYNSNKCQLHLSDTLRTMTIVCGGGRGSEIGDFVWKCGEI